MKHFCEDVDKIYLDPAVFNEIQFNFETAKNLYIYSFFVYRFGMVARLQAFSALEQALKERAAREEVIEKRGWNDFLMKGQSFAKLLEVAVQREWLSRAGMLGHHMEKFTDEGFERAIVSIAKMRNDLAHGSINLFPPDIALADLDLCARLINQLFRNIR